MKHKEHYNDQYIIGLAKKISEVQPRFDSDEFSRNLVGLLDDKELFARFDFIVDAMEKSTTEQSAGMDYQAWYLFRPSSGGNRTAFGQ